MYFKINKVIITHVHFLTFIPKISLQIIEVCIHKKIRLSFNRIKIIHKYVIVFKLLNPLHRFRAGKYLLHVQDVYI